MKMSFDHRAALRAFSFSAPALALASTAKAAPTGADENPELIALAAQFDSSATKYREAEAKFEAAHRAYLSVCHDVPVSLFMTQDEMRSFPNAAICDFNGRRVEHPTQGFRPILTAENLRQEIPLWGGRSRIGKRLRQALPLAEEYEARIAAVVDRSQIHDADAERNHAHGEFETAGWKLFEISPRTLRGLKLQALAIASFHRTGTQRGYKAKHWAVKFAQSFAELA